MVEWFKKNKDKKPPPSEKSARPVVDRTAPASPKGIAVGKILTPELVLLLPSEKDKASVVETLVKRLCAVKKFNDSSAFLKKVMEREQGISTTLDTGLSLPHARIDGITDIAAILGVLPTGIADPVQPDMTIRAMFLFFSPNIPSAFSHHLHLLRHVSAVFQPDFIDQLASAAGSAEALELIRRKEAS